MVPVRSKLQVCNNTVHTRSEFIKLIHKYYIPDKMKHLEDINYDLGALLYQLKTTGTMFSVLTEYGVFIKCRLKEKTTS